VSKSFREFTAELHRLGFFRAQPLAEAVKVVLNLGLYAVAVHCLRVSGWQWTGAFFLALAQQQSGWVGHDYSHHSVFKSPYWNDAVGRFFAWLQGYELQWWKARHNTHHVATNEDGNDPDIRTAPLFTYFTDGNKDLFDSLNALQRQQHIYFLPALALLHVYWRFESLLYIALRLPRTTPHALFLASHYIVLAWLFQDCSWPAILFCFAAKGLMTGAIVFATHYGEERLPKNHGLSLAEQTVRTSRNIAASWLVNHFSGFISYQVEHHLWPTMPRCNYPVVQPMLQLWCRQNGLTYNQDSLWRCLQRNIHQLDYKQQHKSNCSCVWCGSSDGQLVD
jgi:fatty acid desaturase